MPSNFASCVRTLPLAWAAHAPWMEADACGACHSVLNRLRQCVVKGVHLQKQLRLLISGLSFCQQGSRIA